MEREYMVMLGIIHTCIAMQEILVRSSARTKRCLAFLFYLLQYHTAIFSLYSICNSRGTKVGDMLTLAPERYTAELGMVTKVIP